MTPRRAAALPSSIRKGVAPIVNHDVRPREIEGVLHRHPAVLEAAIVAMPHARPGETPMAYVVARSGCGLPFAEMIAFRDEHRLARQKHPEKLVILDAMPRTTSGRTMKHVLRQMNASGRP